MALDIIESTNIKTAWTTMKSVITAVICFVIGLIIFIIAYLGMRQNSGLGTFNQPVLDWMINNRNSQVTSIMEAVTTAASLQIFTVVVIGIAFVWGILKKEIWRPLAFVSSVGFAAGVSTLLKVLTANNRPPQTSMIAPFELDYSFPSGHTISVVVCLLVLGYLIYSRRSSIVTVTSWLILALVGSAIVAISRLYLGYHWLTDVTASLGLGLIILSIIIIIDRIVINRLEN